MTNAPRLTRHLLLAAVALIGMAAARPVVAQGASIPVVAGTRVRVHAQNMVAPLVANFLTMRGDTAVFIEDGGGKGIWSIPSSEIRKIEKSDGEKLSNTPYMLRGAAVGGAIGLAAGLVFANNMSPGDPSRRYNKWGVGAGAAAVGAVVGALIGTRWSVEKWTPVPLRAATVMPTSRGFMASFTLNFELRQVNTLRGRGRRVV